MADALKEQMQRDYAEKSSKLTSQQGKLGNLISWAFWLYSAIAGGIIANQIWSGPFHDFGGSIVRVIMIVILAVVGLIAAVIAYFIVGVFNASVDQGFTKGGRAAVISLIGVAIGTALGAIKGASYTVPSGLLIGLWIGLYVSGMIMAIAATIIFKSTHRGVAEASPWYVKAPNRIVILKSEVVDLPRKEPPPKVSPPKAAPAQTSAAMPQTPPHGASGNPVGQGIEVGSVGAVGQGVAVVRAVETPRGEEDSGYILTCQAGGLHEVKIVEHSGFFNKEKRVIVDGKKISASRSEGDNPSFTYHATSYSWTFKLEGTKCSVTWFNSSESVGYASKTTFSELITLKAKGKAIWSYDKKY